MPDFPRTALRSCGGGSGRGLLQQIRPWRNAPLTRIAAQSDLSPQAGRGFSQRRRLLKNRNHYGGLPLSISRFRAFLLD